MGRKFKKDNSHDAGYNRTTESADLASNTLGPNLSFAANESYKLLRANLSFCMPKSERNCRVIGVTSSTQGEGKSTTSINLSFSLAEAGYRTLLVDCDMRLPTVATRLGLKSSPGLSNIVAGQGGGGGSVQPCTLQKHLYVIASGDIPPNPSELLTSDRMGVVIDELVKYYDYIILDLPPVNIVSDSLAVARLTDGIILVVREDYSEKRGVKDAVSKFKFSQANILGFVLTCAGIDSKHGSYAKSNGSKYKRYSYGFSYAKYRAQNRRNGYGGYSSYGYDRSTRNYQESSDSLRRRVAEDSKDAGK